MEKGAAYDAVRYKNYAETPDFKPGQQVLYQVGDESGVYSEAAILHVPEDSPNHNAFAVFTDTQDTNTVGGWWEKLLCDADKVFPQYGFIVHGGDIVETCVFPDHWSKMLSNTAAHTRSYPMAVATGNHDYWKGYLRGVSGPFYSHFHMALPPQDTDDGVYFSVERGNALILLLNSGDYNKTGGRLTDSQFEWAKRELRDSPRRWKIVIIHNPLFSPGKYGTMEQRDIPCLELRAQLSPLFSEHGADLVICGHDHMFARTYPIGADGHPQTDADTVKSDFLGRSAELFCGAAGPIHFEPACAGHQNRGIECEMTPEQRAPFREMRETGSGEVAWAAVETDENELKVLFRTLDMNSGKCVFESAFGIRKDS